MTTPQMPDSLPRWRTDDLFASADDPKLLSAFGALREARTRLGQHFEALGVRAAGAVTPDAYDQATALLNDLLRQARPPSAFLQALVTTDSHNDAAQARQSELSTLLLPLQNLSTRYKAWLGGANLETLLADSETARQHAYSLQRAVEEARYLLPEGEEELASALHPASGGAWNKLHGNLTSQMRVPFGGQTLPMTAIRNLASDADEQVRQDAYDAELAAWKAAEVPLAAAMNGVKGEAGVLNLRRGHASALDASLLIHGIDRATLDAMTAAIEESLPDFQAYFLSKARRLGHQKLDWHNLLAPQGEAGREWSYAAGAAFIEKQFRSYSDKLGDFAARAFNENWLDAGPRDGKRGGAFCMTWKPEVGESRVLLNYGGTLDAVSTVAHELGHAYHNFCLRHRTPVQSRTPMTLAETASIFCETIVQEAALSEVVGHEAGEQAAGNSAEQLYILETQLMGHAQVVVDIHSRFLFEQAVSARRTERDLSSAELCTLMEQAQRTAYGDALGQAHPYMWAVKPHYYSVAFYNYPYTFGLLFSLGLYARYQAEPETFRAAYDELLASTGLSSPQELAGRFGMNLHDVGFWRSSLDVIRRQIKVYCALD
ncbi:M3 family oligoendopeptidase [Deinococcus detaillensis]|uniref:M3 family oligoendopeptidase n=1 Tax=Deinococcus detaillensis TaxID=2592048 RepID=A0A553V0C9_9DEIO|nr:M3 family oligoendopeptidase [Deinococcus detaillensis]TSA85910.1 M3 family oligoendopeptidase [Deinococcus detaillensis]